MSFFCYSDIFACFAYFANYASLYIFSYSASELQVCLINSVQFSAVFCQQNLQNYKYSLSVIVILNAYSVIMSAELFMFDK